MDEGEVKTFERVSILLAGQRTKDARAGKGSISDVIDRAYNSVDHANKTGNHMTYDAPFKYQALLPSRVYTGDQEKGLACEATRRTAKRDCFPFCHHQVVV